MDSEELVRQVAEKVMEWKKGYASSVPNHPQQWLREDGKVTGFIVWGPETRLEKIWKPHTDMNHLWMVVERMRELGWMVTIEYESDWFVNFWKSVERNEYGDTEYQLLEYDADGNNLNLAVLTAALKAVSDG